MNRCRISIGFTFLMAIVLSIGGCSEKSWAIWQVRHSPNPNKRMQAVKKLGEIGDEEAVSALVEALGEEDVRVSITAMKELSDLEVKAIDALLGALEHESTQVRFRAIQALARMYDDAFELIYKYEMFDLLSGKGTYVNQVGAALINKLADPDLRVRDNVCGLLIKWKWWWKPDSAAVQPLIQAYAAVASESLTQSPPVIVDPMSEAVYRTPDDRRRARYRVIVDLMMETADPRLVPCLIDALSSDDRSVESTAITGLGKIGGAQATRAIISVLDDTSSPSHYQAVNALAKIGDSVAVKRLLEALDDKDEMIRRFTAGALGHVDDPRILPALIEALDDDSVLVRASAAYSLGQTGDARAFKPLRRAMYDDSSIVQESAIQALGMLGDGRAFQPLISTLSHRDPGLRIAAAGALGALGDPRAVPYLEALLDDEYLEVRHAAAHALRDITGRSYEVSEEGARTFPNICSH